MMNIQLHRNKVTKKPYLQIKVPILIGENTLEEEMLFDFLVEAEKKGLKIELIQKGQERDSVAIISIQEVDKITK